MKIESRRWFDQVYEFTEGVLPFGFVTGPINLEEIKIMTRGLYDKETMLKIQKKANGFFQKIPSEEDFLEEKKSVLKKLLPELAKRLSFVDTAIMFGKMVGDIDIGLIANHDNVEERVISEINGDDKLFRRYPIVDWSGMDYFISRDGKEFCEKIINSRLIATKREILSPCSYCYIRNTIDNAIVLWGNKNITYSIIDTLDNKLMDYVVISSFSFIFSSEPIPTPIA